MGALLVLAVSVNAMEGQSAQSQDDKPLDDKSGVAAVSVNATGDASSDFWSDSESQDGKPLDDKPGVAAQPAVSVNVTDHETNLKNFAKLRTKRRATDLSFLKPARSAWAPPAKGIRTASSEILHGVRDQRDLQTKAEEEETRRKAIAANTKAIKDAQAGESRRRLINRFIR